MLKYSMSNNSCKSLLVRGVNWIGDSVMTLPAIRAIKRSLPESNISLLVKPWVSPIFEKNPFLDEILLYENKHQGFFGKIRIANMLHRKRFLCAILFQNAFDAALLAFLSGIKERIGYDRDARGFLLTKKIPLPEYYKQKHQIFYYLNLLENIGIKTDLAYPYIYLLLEERLAARQTLINLRKPILGVNPGATYGSAKRWFPERFAEIINWFISETGGSIIIFGSKNETNIADDIYKKILPAFRSPEIALNLAGNTSLRELITLISECDVFVTNDSGPMHIAYAVRTPMVAIFGSTDPALTGPPPYAFMNNNIVIKSELSCSPCFKRECDKNDLNCMYAITSDDVYFAIKKLLPFRSAVFFDRDGTLNMDLGYINRHEDFKVFDDISSLLKLKEKGFKIIGISNQSGIGRGIVNESFVKEINRIFIEKYGFDNFYHCPHIPEEHCACRKPEPEMLFLSRAEYKIDLKKSYVVGDKDSDMLLAKAVGAKAILVQTGKLRESSCADYTAKNLIEAVDYILKCKN